MDSEKGWTLLFWAMIIIGVLAVLFRGDDIEQDLADRANAALHNNGLQWASVKDVEGRNLSLTGEAPVKAQKEWPRHTIENLYGIRNVNDEDIGVKNPVSPYVWAAIVTPEKITLTGSVPDEDTRAAIREQITKIISDRTVSDKMVLADGAPETGWLENINNILKYTKYLKNGAVHLNDRSVKVEGEAWNALDFEVIALRASRGRTVNDYAFSSDLHPPAGIASQALNTIAPSALENHKETTSEEPATSGEPVTSGEPDKPETLPAAEKPGPKAEETKIRSVADEAGSIDEDAGQGDESMSPAPPSAEPEKPVKPAAPQQAAAPVQGVPPLTAGPELKQADPGSALPVKKNLASETGKPAGEEKPEGTMSVPVNSADEGAEKIKASDTEPTVQPAAKNMNEKKPVESKTVAGKAGQEKRITAPSSIPRYMIAPPWAFAPYPAAPPAGYYQPPAYYPAPRAYMPSCGYGYPYAPAYCGWPAY